MEAYQGSYAENLNDFRKHLVNFINNNDYRQLLKNLLRILDSDYAELQFLNNKQVVDCQIYCKEKEIKKNTPSDFKNRISPDKLKHGQNIQTFSLKNRKVTESCNNLVLADAVLIVFCIKSSAYAALLTGKTEGELSEHFSKLAVSVSEFLSPVLLIMNKLVIMEKQKEESESKYRLLLENSQDLLKRIDADSNINRLLKRTQSQVIQNERMASIGQLAAGVAHELNNPLSFVQTNFNTMKRYIKFLNETINNIDNCIAKTDIDLPINRKKLDLIRMDLVNLYFETEDGVRRMVEIVKSLNAFSRVDNEKEKGWSDINKSIEGTLILAKNKYKYYASIVRDLNELPSIYCNDGEIKQVFLNIVVNAAQALEQSKAKAESGIIKISSFFDQKYVNVIFEDNGPGIPEEIREKIVVPFFTTKKAGEGTGLGLSISHDIIVNRHRGIMEIAESEYGGAKFTIKLPAGDSEKEEIQPAEQPHPV